MTVADRVDLAKLAASPIDAEKVLLTGLPDNRVLVQSTFRDTGFLIRVLKIALEGAELMGKQEQAADEAEAKKTPSQRRRKRNMERKKRLPPPATPDGLG